MREKYFPIIIAMMVLVVGVFFYLRKAEATVEYCGVAEQCPSYAQFVEGVTCTGFPTGPSQTCDCGSDIASCVTGGQYVCTLTGVPSIFCSGGQTCECLPNSQPDPPCSVTNVCGVVTTGTKDANGNCSATPAPTPANYGNSCTAISIANDCGATATSTGTIQCDGTTCSAVAPAPPPTPVNYGNTCTATSNPNACGQSNTVTGTIQCNSVCSAYSSLTEPPNPPGYGTACDDGDACTTGETIQCSEACGGGSAVAGCGVVAVTISANPNPISYNTATTITWSSINATFCTVSPGGWTGTSGARSTGNLITNTNYTASCTGPGGSGSASVTVIVNAAPTLTVSLSANSSGNAPLTTNFTAIVGGTSTGTINYTFWWHCLYAGTNVSAAITQCGDPDGTTGNANGNKYNGATSTSQDSISHTYATAGTFTPLVIVERGGLAARATTTVTVSLAPTLEVSLSANPFSGTGSINSILTAAVSGTVTGPVDYTFWWNCGYSGTDASIAAAQCGNPDGSNGNANGNSFNNINSTSQNSVSHLYPTGTYTSLVIAERGGLVARAVRGISVSNSPPSIANVTLTEPDYCSSGPGGFVSWTYTDAENDPQAAYRVQVLNQSDSVIYDSGQTDINSTSFVIPSRTLQFNTVYYVRVMAWEVNTNLNSGWVSQTICNGPGCAANDLTWRTPLHAYPRVAFSWMPPSPSGNQTVIFTDATTFSDGNVGGTRTWNWTAPSANPSSGTASVFTTKYTIPGIYNVTDTVADSIGYVCALSQPVTVQESIPIWKEVGPK